MFLSSRNLEFPVLGVTDQCIRFFWFRFVWALVSGFVLVIIDDGYRI